MKDYIQKYINNNDAWWFECAQAWIPDNLFTVDEIEICVKALVQFLNNRFRDGETPQQAVISLASHFKDFNLPAVPFPEPQSEWFWVTKNNMKIRSKVLFVNEGLEYMLVRPVSDEEYRLTENMKKIRRVFLCHFCKEYEKIQ